jgi:hypothetical protein
LVKIQQFDGDCGEFDEAGEVGEQFVASSCNARVNCLRLVEEGA